MNASESLNLELGSGPKAIGAARRALGSLSGEVESGLIDDVRLLVSELVTNSVRHGSLGPGDPIELEVKVFPNMLRVRVTNPGTGFEMPAHAADRGTVAGGWGLYLVDRLADRWGIVDEDTTCVWFEIERRQAKAS